MGEKFYLSSDATKNSHLHEITTLGGGWQHSDIYYDSQKDCFVEESYHEEYLDTGTVCDGCENITDEYLWAALISACNEKGIERYLKFRNSPPSSVCDKETISFSEFHQGINNLRSETPWRNCGLRRIDDTIIIRTEASSNLAPNASVILGVIGKTEYFYYFYSTQSGASLTGFHSFEGALAYALKMVTNFYEIRLGLDKMEVKEKKTTSEPYKPQQSKQSFFDRLRRK